MKKAIISFVIIVLLGLGVVSFYYYQKNNEKNNEKKEFKKSEMRKTTKVDVIKINKTTFYKTLTLTGNVEPFHTANLATSSEGPIIKITVREGDIVNKGDLLVLLGRKKGVESSIFSIKEELKKEKENLDKTTQLVEKSIIPAEQLDIVKTNYEKIQTQLIKAEEQLNDFIIKAPWNGIVSKVNLKEGEYASPRSVILEIYDPLTLVVSVNIPEKYALTITNENEAEITFDSLEGKTFKGKITRIYPFLDSNLRTRKAEMVIDEKINLLPNMFARIKLNLYKIENAILIPLNAVKINQNGEYFVFIAKDGKAMSKQIKTGIEQGEFIEAIDGISTDDLLITTEIQKLRDGETIEIR